MRFRVWKWVAWQVILLSSKMSLTLHYAIFKINSISNLVYYPLTTKTNAFQSMYGKDYPAAIPA